MKLRTLTVLMGVIVLGGALSMPTQAAQNASSGIISFEVPGADTTANDYNGTFPSGINNWEVVTGSYIDVNDVYHGFIRSPDGKFTTFEVRGADTTKGSYNGTIPNAINDLGWITGVYFDASGTGHGFLLGPEGQFTAFDVPGAVGYSNPLAINLEGAVVGTYLDSNSVFRAFLRSPDGKFTTFLGPDGCNTSPAAGCFGTAAFNINIFGTIAAAYEDNSGNFVNVGLVRSPEGHVTPFEAPGAGAGSYQGTGCPGCALGLNQWGAIAGTYTDANNVFHGFLRGPEGGFTTFEAPGAGTGSNQGTGCFSDCSVSLNDLGTIAGIYIDANSIYHGFLRTIEGNFASVDPTGSEGTFPAGINDLQVVTGYYIDANNVYHGFLRIPSRFP